MHSRSQLDLMLDALETCLCNRLAAEPGNALIDQAFQAEAAVILKAASPVDLAHTLSRLTHMPPCASAGDSFPCASELHLSPALAPCRDQSADPGQGAAEAQDWFLLAQHG